MKFFNLFVVAMTLSGSADLAAQTRSFWTEKDVNAAPMVNLPHLGPVIDLVDATVVNIATTSEPKAQPQRPQRGNPRGPQQEQGDPFMNPEDFFERFFGNPFRDQQQQPRRSLGSGFIISKDGYIVTNNHVIEGADKIEVTIFSNGERRDPRELLGDKFQAKIVGRDPATDLALIKIDPKKELPVAPLGNSTRIRKGDWVLAFGNPFGLDHSVSLGIVSATGREISSNENRRFDDFIQTDAAINFGNSGGPLINLKGEVVGVNTAITAQGSGIGFAVPVNILKDILTQLKDSGSVSRGYLGVMIQDVSEEIKDALGLKEARGVVINDIVPNGPAAKSQLQRGDVIIKINGEDVNNSRDLQRTVAKSKPNAEVNVQVIRDKKMNQVSVRLGNLSDDTAADLPEESKGKHDKLGLIVGNLPDGSGVIVQDISAESSANAAGILPGDIIRRINNTVIPNVTQYQKIVGSVKSKQTLLMDLERRNLKLFIAFRVP